MAKFQDISKVWIRNQSIYKLTQRTNIDFNEYIEPRQNHMQRKEHKKEKKLIIDQLKKDDSFQKKRELSQKYNTSIKNITRWYMRGTNRKPGQGKKKLNSKAEQQLFYWCIEQIQGAKRKLSNKQIQEKAKELFNIQTFRASKAWTSNFLNNYDLKYLQQQMLYQSNRLSDSSKLKFEYEQEQRKNKNYIPLFYKKHLLKKKKKQKQSINCNDDNLNKSNQKYEIDISNTNFHQEFDYLGLEDQNYNLMLQNLPILLPILENQHQNTFNNLQDNTNTNKKIDLVDSNVTNLNLPFNQILQQKIIHKTQKKKQQKYMKNRKNNKFQYNNMIQEEESKYIWSNLQINSFLNQQNSPILFCEESYDLFFES